MKKERYGTLHLIFITNNSYALVWCKDTQQTILHRTCILELIDDNCFPWFLTLIQHYRHITGVWVFHEIVKHHNLYIQVGINLLENLSVASKNSWWSHGNPKHYKILGCHCSSAELLPEYFKNRMLIKEDKIKKQKVKKQE